MKVVRHTLDGETKTHLPGSGLCDFQTACGSCWDDGEFEYDGEAERIDCAGCEDVARTIFEALGKRMPKLTRPL